MESFWSIKLCVLGFSAAGAGRRFSFLREFSRKMERRFSVGIYVHGEACLREYCMCKCDRRKQCITPSRHQSVIHNELYIWYPQWAVLILYVLSMTQPWIIGKLHERCVFSSPRTVLTRQSSACFYLGHSWKISFELKLFSCFAVKAQHELAIYYTLRMLRSQGGDLLTLLCLLLYCPGRWNLGAYAFHRMSTMQGTFSPTIE